jgi:TetR/AcrR family acrAB operon transcriptional repressor
MRKTKEEAEATRKTIFKTALLIFSKKGYSATRLEDIAQRAGVTRGAIYWHFKNKFDLYYQLMEESFSGYANRVKKILEADDSPLNRIRSLMKETLISLEKDEEYRAAEEILFFKTELTKEMKDPSNAVVDHNHNLRTDLAELIQRGIQSGEIKSGTDPYIASIVLISFLNGTKITWLMDTSAFSLIDMADKLINFQLCTITA